MGNAISYNYYIKRSQDIKLYMHHDLNYVKIHRKKTGRILAKIFIGCR